jgi:hypothetical protein
MSEGNVSETSPLSTGGAGTIVEYRLAGIMLAKLLLGASAPGITKVIRVCLQGAAAGHRLDDIIAFSSSAKLPRVEMQVKRTMHPVSSDKEFIGALEQCLRAMKDHGDAIDRGELQLCLASTGPVPQLNALKELTDIARMHADCSSLQTVLAPRITAEVVRDRFIHAKQALANITQARGQKLRDDDLNLLTHRLLRAMRIWCIEVGQEGRDVQDVINRLVDIVPHDLSAADVFTHLIAIAEEQGQRAGVLDSSRLRALLLQRGVSLSADPKKQKQLAVLQASSDRFLQDVRHTIGVSFHLSRPLAINAVIEAITKEKITLLSGSPGVGKTVLMREALLEIAKTGTVVGLNIAGRTHQSLAHIQVELGGELATTLPAAATTGPRVFFIDGAEQILTDSGQLLAAILSALPSGEEAPEWHIVATSRSDAAPMVAQRLWPAKPLKPLSIDELSDDEVAAVVNAFPLLSPLQRHPRSARLLRRPYLVDLFIRANISADAEQSLGEEDVLLIFWQHLVRLSEGAMPGRGSPDVREQICLELAEATIMTTDPAKPRTVNGEALAGLRSDDILARNRMYHQFAHDILLDYACAYRLLEADANVLLDRVVAPRRLLRAVRLAAQRRLADVSNQPRYIISLWKAIRAQAAALAMKDGERWDDIPFLALINLGNPEPVFNALKGELLINEGEQLFKLLNVTRSYATTAHLEAAREEFEIDVLLAAPIVALLALIGADLPASLSSAASELTRRWLLALHSRGDKVANYIPNPIKLPTALLSWLDNGNEYSENLDVVLSSLGLLADYWPEEANSLIERLGNQPRKFAPLVENPDVAPIFARLNPKLCLSIATAYYLRWQSKEHASAIDDMPVPRAQPKEKVYGIRDHDSRYFMRRKQQLAGPMFGPFSGLLAASPEHGLKLVDAIVETATAARIKLENARNKNGPTTAAPIVIIMAPMGVKAPKSYRGTANVWVWYRGGGTGPYPAMSALMALREWALQQSEQCPISDVVAQILGSGDSIAFPAVALSLLIAHISDLTDELDSFLEQLYVWQLEYARLGQEEANPIYPLPHDDLLRLPFDHVVMRYVLRSTNAHRDVLKNIGEHLVQAMEAQLSQKNHFDVQLVRKWASLLNYDLYRFEKINEDGMTALTIDYSPDLIEALNEDATPAELHVQITSVLHTAIQIRDGKAIGNPVALWKRVHTTLNRMKELDIKLELYNRDDIIAGIAAGVVVAVAEGKSECPDEILQRAAKALVDIAMGTIPATQREDSDEDQDAIWPFGFDRSAAAALPLLLRLPKLLQCTGVSPRKLNQALLKLAHGVSSESRKRLVLCLDPVWETECNHTEHRTHDVSLTVLIELVRTAGFGERAIDTRMPPVYLSGSLSHKLVTNKHILDLTAASDALPGLIRAARLTCRHGYGARALLNALIEHDLLAWSKHHIKQHYTGEEDWRDSIDTYVAEQVLDGNTQLLIRYLEAFAPTPEALSGMLYQLAAQAKTKEQRYQFLGVWPMILDRLLPAARTGCKGRYVYSGDIDNLNASLLPILAEPLKQLPVVKPTLLERWVRAFPASPQLLDRLIKALVAYGLVLHPDSISFVLNVAGDDYERISRNSSLVVPWIRVLLFGDGQVTDSSRMQLIKFLDQLAKRNSHALKLQRDLEA